MPKWMHLQQKDVWQLTEKDSIFSSGNSPYQFNINHPLVLKRYNEYRKEINEEVFPLSAAQRMKFEQRILQGYYPELTQYLRGENNVHLS